MFNHLRLSLFLFGCMAAQNLCAQTLFHPANGIQNTYAGACTENLCAGTYVDDGGTGSNYSDNINNVYRTFCPGQQGQCIRLTFVSFALEAPDANSNCYDYLSIGNGPTQNSPQLWQGCGTTLPPVITSTDPSGCITVRFVSDALNNAAGWRANVSCVPCSGTPGPSATLNTDCSNARYICDNPSGILANSQGPGLVSDACISGCAVSENYSNWFIMNVTAGGLLGMTITPVPNSADYDFALYGPVTGGCGSLGTPIRCSYAANTGTTGMRSISSDASEDVLGDGWVSEPTLSAGTYYLLINQWAYEPNSTFSIDFTGQASIALPTQTVSSNSPVCDTVKLTAPTIAGATYSWSGPGGWTSNQQNPTRFPAVAGTYTFSYSLGGCTSGATTINVQTTLSIPQPTISSNAPLCDGDTLKLSVPVLTGATYVWNGPGGWTSNQQNPTRFPVVAGTYTCWYTQGGCAGPSASVTISAPPNLLPPIVSSNSPLCDGETLQLTTSSVNGATYAWSGPNGWTSSAQNPTRLPVVAGIYSLSYTLNGCTSPASSITVQTTPGLTQQTISSNSPACDTDTLKLSVPTLAGATYAWSGPGGWTSNQQNPTRSPVVAGTYTFTYTQNGCTSPASSISITAPPSLTPPNISSNSPLCDNSVLQLAASTINGATYAWSGPGGWTSSAQNPTRTPAVAGTYTCSYSLNGCTSSTASTSVTINNPPAVLINPGSVTIQQGSTIVLTVTGTGNTYTWSTSETSSSITVSPANTTTYTVTATDLNGCIASATATVNVIPDTTIGIGNVSHLDFSIVPNPAQDVIIISGNFNRNAVYEIINELGQIVLSDAMVNADNMHINIKNLHAGIYLVRIKSNDKVGVKKLFVNE